MPTHCLMGPHRQSGRCACPEAHTCVMHRLAAAGGRSRSCQRIPKGAGHNLPGLGRKEPGTGFSRLGQAGGRI